MSDAESDALLTIYHLISTEPPAPIWDAVRVEDGLVVWTLCGALVMSMPVEAWERLRKSRSTP